MNILITNAVIRDVIIAGAAVVVAAATVVPGGSSSFSVLWGTAVEGRVTDLVRGGSRDWPSLAALTTEPTTTYDRRHGQCSLQSPNYALESQIFSLPGRTFLFNHLFLVIQSIHFHNLTVCPAAGGRVWLLALHGESVCPKMGTDFIPKSEIINKCAAYRPDIS